MFAGIAHKGPKPVLEKPLTVRCLDWDGVRPSITVRDMLEAEDRHRGKEMSGEEWERVRDWFAPWADCTGERSTSIRWWKNAYDKIGMQVKSKPHVSRRLIDRCFNNLRHDNTSWDALCASYSYVNDQERKHTMFNLRSAIDVMIKTCDFGLGDERVRLVREAFYQASSGTSKNVLAGWIIWVVGMPCVVDLAWFYLGLGLFRMDRQGYIECTKAITTAMQKTMTVPHGRGYRDLGIDELAQGAYIAEFTGRAGFVFSWDVDIADRCRPSSTIPLFSYDTSRSAWTEERWWEHLYEEMLGLHMKTIPDKTLDETPDEHYDRRQMWMSSGSTGGATKMVDVDAEEHEKRICGLLEKEDEIMSELAHLGLKVGTYKNPFTREGACRSPDKAGCLLTRKLWVALGGNEELKHLVEPSSSKGKASRMYILYGLEGDRCHFYGGRLPTVSDNKAGGAAEDGSVKTIRVSDDVLGMRKVLDGLWRRHVSNVADLASVRARHKERVRISKRTLAEDVDYDEMIRETEPPKLEAVGSQKWDRVKPRSIHGQDYYSYSRLDYVVGHLEKGSVKSDYLCGLLGPDEQARMDDGLMNKGTFHFCADHDNYDLIHSLRAQAMRYEIARDHPPNVSGRVIDEWRRECDWAANLVKNQYLRIPEKGETYKVSQGGFTGSRDTSFRNDCLHYVYEAVARRNASLILGKFEPEVQRIRGDDIHAKYAAWSQCCVQLSTMMRMGFKLNAAKQLIGRIYGVFLRVIYSSGLMKGYAARSIGSLIMQPLQAKERVDVRSRVTALSAHVHLLVRRGMRHTVAAAIWDNLVSFWGRVKLDEKGGFVRVPRRVICGKAEDGGWGLSAPGKKCVYMPRGVPSFPSFKCRVDQISAVSGNKMSSAYVAKIASRFGDVSPEEAASFAQAYRKKNVEPDATPSDMKESWRAYGRDVKEWLEKARRMLSSYPMEGQGAEEGSGAGKYIIAPPGSGKSTEIRRGCLGKALDADELLAQGKIDWQAYASEDYHTWLQERRKGAEIIVESVRAGNTVLGAHNDYVLVHMLTELGLDVIRVESDLATRLHWLRRRDGLVKARRIASPRRSGPNEAYKRSLGLRLLSLDDLPVAPSLDQAVYNEFYRMSKLSTEGRGCLRITGVRNGYLECGEWNYIKCARTPVLSAVSSLTAPGSEGLIQEAARIRGVKYHVQLINELSNRMHHAAAYWVGIIGSNIQHIEGEGSLLDESITGRLSPSMTSVANRQYWMTLTDGLITPQGLDVNVNKARAHARDIVESCVSRAFIRDKAGRMVCY